MKFYTFGLSTYTTTFVSEVTKESYRFLITELELNSDDDGFPVYRFYEFLDMSSKAYWGIWAILQDRPKLDVFHDEEYRTRIFNMDIVPRTIQDAIFDDLWEFVQDGGASETLENLVLQLNRI